MTFNINSLYTSKDLESRQFEESFPGSWPYTRGPYDTMYTRRPWTIRQYAGFSTADETNAFYRKALGAGQKGISVAFDLATHRGYDSDHPNVEGDVGKAGVAVDTVEDMKKLFDGIPLQDVSVSMTMNGAVLPVMACFIVAAEEQGTRQNQLSGTIQNDILKEFMVRNTYIYPPEPSMRIVSDIMAYTHRHMPRFNSISVSGYHMHEAGATSVQELAFTIADGLEYLESALKAGLQVDDVAPRFSFFFGIGMNFLTEIAKLRAARMLWARLVKERYHPANEKSLLLRMHCQTSGWSLTAQDPLNNIVRTTLEAMAGVLGGTQSLHTNSFDEALSLPTDQSARIARNTQLILQHETDLCRTIDPFAGSFAMESMTADIASEAEKLIRELMELGGMTRAIEAGIPQRRIQEASAARQAAIDSGKEKMVGVNVYQSEDAGSVEVFDVDNKKVLAMQKASLEQIRNGRDADKVRDTLEMVRKCSVESGTMNLLEAMVEAARARATVGEMSEALEKTWGRHKAAHIVIGGVYRQFYDNENVLMEIAGKVEAFARREGRRPRILVVKMGQDGHDRGARIVATTFADLGFDVDLGPLFLTPEGAARQAIENDVHVIGVSSLAGAHKTLIPKLLDALKRENASEILVVAGGVIPEKDAAWLKSLGVVEIFGPGTKTPDAASRVLEALSAKWKEKK